MYRYTVRAIDSSAPVLRNCHLENNTHEGVVAMQQATVTLVDCVIRDNKGPGLDASDRARLVLERCKVETNVGGLWLWDEASCDVRASVVSGGHSHAVLCDQNTAPRFGLGSRIEGGGYAYFMWLVSFLLCYRWILGSLTKNKIKMNGQSAAAQVPGPRRG